MIRKTTALFKRMRPNGIGSENHIQRIHRETWWLFWVVPLYSRDTIVTHNM